MEVADFESCIVFRMGQLSLLGAKNAIKGHVSAISRADFKDGQGMMPHTS